MATDDSGKIKAVGFSLFRDALDTLVVRLINQIDREFPSALSAIPGLRPYFLVSMMVLRNTYEAIRYLCADIPEDPSRKTEFGLAANPLVRSIADLLFTIVFMSEDLPKRVDWYHRGGWREVREDYERHFKEYGTIPEWEPYLKSYKAALDVGAKTIGMTPADVAVWQTLRFWPTPPQMLRKNSPILPNNRKFLEYVQAWLYRGLSQKTHLSGAGILQAYGFLLIKEEERREAILGKLKSDCVFTATTLVVSYCSEGNSICNYGLDSALLYLWKLLTDHWGEAKDLFDRRYISMLKV